MQWSDSNLCGYNRVSKTKMQQQVNFDTSIWSQCEILAGKNPTSNLKLTTNLKNSQCRIEVVTIQEYTQFLYNYLQY